MKQATALLGLRAVAPIHVGTDDLRGVIDLAIQREKHNNWPVVYGSSVKGALREAAASQWVDEASALHAIFGAQNNGGNGGNGGNASGGDHRAEQTNGPVRDHIRAGALLVNEMRLLALPVAALNSVYKWVTCPEALRRLRRDYQMFGIATACPAIPALQNSDAISFNLDDPANIFLREYLFHKRSADDAEQAWPAQFTSLFGADESEFRQRLLIVSDARFGHLVETCTAIAPHIKLDKNKTTTDGALWYEETLPSETLMYLPLASEHERLSKSQQTAAATPQDKQALLEKVLTLFAPARPYLRVGANETTGMGWFQVHIAGRGA
jgi:CRISPR-associated protein Cmr4